MRKTSTQFWPDAWKGICDKLQDIDWSDFRSSKASTTHIEGSTISGIKFWIDCCQEEEIPLEYCKDTLIGNPYDKLKTVVDGVTVTANSCRHAYNVNQIKKHAKETTDLVVLEVGGGYGGFAEQLCRRFGVSSYHFIDHPVIQMLQGYYMIKVGHGDKISFEIPDSVDLIVSTQSLGEMPETEVKKYIEIFERVLKPDSGLMYLVQGSTKNKPYIFVPWEEYVFDPKWKLTVEPYVRPHVVQCWGRRSQ